MESEESGGRAKFRDCVFMRYKESCIRVTLPIGIREWIWREKRKSEEIWNSENASDGCLCVNSSNRSVSISEDAP